MIKTSKILSPTRRLCIRNINFNIFTLKEIWKANGRSWTVIIWIKNEPCAVYDRKKPVNDAILIDLGRDIAYIWICEAVILYGCEWKETGKKNECIWEEFWGYLCGIRPIRTSTPVSTRKLYHKILELRINPSRNMSIITPLVKHIFLCIATNYTIYPGTIKI